MGFPATNKQLPDHSMLDHFNKQTYLGNQYSASSAFTVGTGETALILLNNIQSGSPQTFPALFQNLLKVVENTAAHSVILNVYLSPTIAAGAQTVALVADSSGSLNSTFFLLDSAFNKDLYYVWFSINSAGVDPAVAGRTGIKVSGATGATAATLGAAMVTAINTAASFDFTASGTSTVTITNTTFGPFTGAVDGSAPTSFTFAVTAGSGAPLTSVNMRSAYGTTNSVAQISKNPTASANGTLVDSISAAAQSVSQSDLLRILDEGQSLLVTSIASASSTSINAILQWYEL